MNPSERETKFVILFDVEHEQQRGSFYTTKEYKEVAKKEEILKEILKLVKYKNAKAFRVFALGRRLEVDWK